MPDTQRHKGYAQSIAAACLCFSLLTDFSHAEQINSDAAVNLLFGLTLTENQEVDFGAISGASTGSCTMGITGNLSGTPLGCTGTGTPGQFTVSGLRFFQVTVTVNPGSSDGITFTPDFGGPTTLSGFLPATSGFLGSATLNVGGTISWTGTLTPGPKVIPFTFTADFN